MKSFSIAVSAVLRDELQEAAEAQGVSVAALVRRFIKDGLADSGIFVKAERSTGRPPPHPTAVIFARHRMKKTVIARRTGLSYSFVVRVLLGTQGSSARTDARLQALADELEKG